MATPLAFSPGHLALVLAGNGRFCETHGRDGAGTTPFVHLAFTRAIPPLPLLCQQEISINAAQISIANKLAMADSLILATARAYKATLWTQDADFAGMEGVRFIAK